SEDEGEEIEEDALAVATRAVNEEQSMLAGIAGEAIAGDLLQETNQLLVSARGLSQELEPTGWNAGLRHDASEPRDHVGLASGMHLTGLEIDRPAGCAELPRIRIPDSVRHGVHRIGASECLNTPSNAGAGQGGLTFSLLNRRAAAEMESEQRLVPLPMLAGPLVPATRAVVEAQGLAIPFGEGPSDRVLRHVTVALALRLGFAGRARLVGFAGSRSSLELLFGEGQRFGR